MRRLALTLVCLATAGSVLSVSRGGLAQQGISVEDRANARDLFKAGFQAQQGAKYEEALDKFTRAQAIFPAPTNMLHIAECQAQLGRLVEAGETYRGLARLQLPKDSPQSFFAAQTQGAAELQQVEARIPKIRVDVTPPNVPNMVVTIDEQPMNTALVGVERVIDPGTHKIIVFAPGYGRQEQTITVKEKDPTKQVTLAMQPTTGAGGGGGIVYGPAPTSTGAPPPPPPVYTTQPPPPPADQQPGYKEWQPPKRSNLGIYFGPRLGALVPSGDVYNGRPVGDVAGPGASLGLEFDLRFARKGHVGALFEHGFYGAGGSPQNFFQARNGQLGASSNLAGISLGFISNPEGFGIILDAALAYRWLTVSQTGGTDTTGVALGDLSATEAGGELMLGGGFWIAAGNHVRITPRIDVGIGQFTSLSCDSNTTQRPLCTSPQASAYHAFIFLGVGGYYNLDFK